MFADRSANCSLRRSLAGVAALPLALAGPMLAAPAASAEIV
jgi:hypothetical protein